MHCIPLITLSGQYLLCFFSPPPPPSIYPVHHPAGLSSSSCGPRFELHDGLSSLLNLHTWVIADTAFIDTAYDLVMSTVQPSSLTLDSDGSVLAASHIWPKSLRVHTMVALVNVDLSAAPLRMVQACASMQELGISLPHSCLPVSQSTSACRICKFLRTLCRNCQLICVWWRMLCG